MSYTTIDTRKNHDLYDGMDEHTKDTIDAAYKAVVAVLKSAGMPTANDDRAEELVAAITYYSIRSNE